MDFVFWIILIVLIVGVVWWLLNRSNSSRAGDSTPVRMDGGLAGGSAAASAEAAGMAGIPSAAGFGAAEPAPPTTADEAPVRSNTAGPREADAGPEASIDETSTGEASVGTEGPSHPEEPAGPEEQAGPEEHAEVEEPDGQATGGQANVGRQADEDEWETQWSEAGAPPHAVASHRPAGEASTATPAVPLPEEPPEEPPAQKTEYVHHPEYTEPHSPTLPGAETAAAEAAPEPTGHLAADRPYGAGSASPGPDGSGPADFDVKADAATMVYYEEGHADYEQTKADVWFESAAHAEAAGFRAPRRTRT